MKKEPVDFLIMISILAFSFFCVMWMSSENSPEKEQEKKNRKRWAKFLDGKIPCEEMTWCEKLYYYIKRGRSYDNQVEAILSSCQDKILHRHNNQEYNHFGIPSELDSYISGWFSQKAATVTDYVDFVSCYARLINEFDCLEGIIWTAYKQPTSVKIALYRKCIEFCNNQELKERYIRSLGPLEEQVRQEEQVAIANRHKNDLESRGGFNSVVTGKDYEVFVAFCLKDAGASIKRVGQSGDYGADVVADCGIGGRVVIQCKFYSSAVGYDAVKEVFTAKSIYKGKHAWVVSNAGYTSQAMKAARKLGVKLLSHEEVDAEVRTLRGR